MQYIYIYIYIYIYTHTHTQTMEYYPAIKNKVILPFAAIWMDFQGIKLSEMSDREIQIVYVLTDTWNMKVPNSQRVEWWLPEASGWGKGELLAKWYKLPAIRQISSEDLII